MSKILDIAHEMAKDLFEVGAMDEVTMRTVESLCLPEKRVFLPEDIEPFNAGEYPTGLNKKL